MLVHSLRRGGAERVLLEIALGLQKRGYVVEVVSWLDVDEYQDAGYKLVNRHYLLQKDKYRWVRSIPYSAELLRRIVAQFKPDIIEIHTPNVAWLAVWAGLDIPFVHVLHGYGDITRYGTLKNEIIHFLSLLVARKLRVLFVTVSDSMIPFAARYFRANQERFCYLPNGIDHHLFSFKQKLPDNSPVILILGTLCPNKGQALGIQAFKIVLGRFPNAKLRIVGEGPDRKVLEELVMLSGLDGNVGFLGLRKDVPLILSTTHILWQLSESEAMPMAVLEAMSSGVPVVGFDVRGTRDAVVHRETGCLIPYGNTDLVAKATIQLLDDPIKYQRYSLNSRQRVERCFSLDSMVDGHEQLLCSIVDKT